jgi:hypothetical protein
MHEVCEQIDAIRQDRKYPQSQAQPANPVLGAERGHHGSHGRVGQDKRGSQNTKDQGSADLPGACKRGWDSRYQSIPLRSIVAAMKITIKSQSDQAIGAAVRALILAAPGSRASHLLRVRHHDNPTLRDDRLLTVTESVT